jgi:bacteriocin-like protein
MSGGGGHILDMSNTIRRNRAMRNKKKFKSDYESKIKVWKEKQLKFKELSEEELAHVYEKISRDAKKQKEIIIFSIVIFIIILFTIKIILI